MNALDLQPGTKIEIISVENPGLNNLNNNDDASMQETYISQLFDIIDEENLVIACPMKGTQLIPLLTGSKLEIMLYHSKYHLLTFFAVVTKRYWQDGIAVLDIKKISDFKKVQRRKFFRLNSNLIAEYRIFDESTAAKQEEVPYQRTYTKDISGNGVCIFSSTPIPVGTDLELILWLNEKTSVKAICTVARNTNFDLDDAKVNLIGLHFKTISQKEQDLLVKFIFQEQKKVLKNLKDK